MRHNITREKRKPAPNPRELTASKRTKTTVYTNPSTTSPGTCNPQKITPLNYTFTLKSQPLTQPRPPQFPPSHLSPTTSQPLTIRHHLPTHHTDTTKIQDSSPYNTHPIPRPPPCQSYKITHLMDALNTHDQHIKTLIKSLPEDWAGYNDRGSLVTKRQLLQSAWGELKESDSLQAFQPAILTALPPPTTTVTQYTTYLTSAICMDSTLW